MRHLRKMTAKYSASALLGGALALGSVAMLSGCDNNDSAAETAEDAVEDAGDAVGDAIDETGDAIDDIGDDIEN